MALKSLEIASDGLLAGGNSLSIAVRGLLRTSAIVAALGKVVHFHHNLGRLMHRR